MCSWQCEPPAGRGGGFGGWSCTSAATHGQRAPLRFFNSTGLVKRARCPGRGALTVPQAQPLDCTLHPVRCVLHLRQYIPHPVYILYIPGVPPGMGIGGPACWRGPAPGCAPISPPRPPPKAPSSSDLSAVTRSPHFAWSWNRSASNGSRSASNRCVRDSLQCPDNGAARVSLRFR
jgi:hypothetical protein